MTRPATLDDIASYLAALPARLGIWRTAGRHELWPLLAWLNVWPVQELRATAQETGIHLGSFLRHTELHNAVGVAVKWVSTYLGGNVLGSHSEEMERRGLMRHATDSWILHDLLRSARAGVYDFEAEGSRLRFRFAGDPKVEALDKLLSMAFELQMGEQLRQSLHGGDGSPPVPFDDLRRYVVATRGHIPWEEVDGAIHDGFTLMANKTADGMRRVLAPDSLPLADFTLGEALSVWKELLAGALYRSFCLYVGSCNPLVAAPLLTREELSDELAACDVQRPTIESVVDFLSFDPAHDEDPCLAPLIPVGSGLVPMSSLITPSSPERNILARLRTDPHVYGPIGYEVGRIGPRTVAAELERIPHVRVTTEVKVRDSTGRPLGDLDVVALDEGEKLVVIFEVKWQLEPDGAKELDKAELQAQEGQAQIRQLRPPVESGRADVRWSADWPELSDCEWRWFVITSNVIPVTRVRSDDVPARSHRVLTMLALRQGARLREVCDVFANPPLPEFGTELFLDTRVIGPYQIIVEAPP